MTEYCISSLKLHLPTQELRALWLLGECRPLVQDCLENLPLLVQLVNNLKMKREHQILFLI